MEKSILFIVGSPRLTHSTSYSIAEYLSTGLKNKGWKTDIMFSHKLYTSDEKVNGLREKIEHTNIVGIVFPLYVDAVPGPLVHLLNRIGQKPLPNKNQHNKIFTIVNSGFPEPHQNEIAVQIIHQFTKEYKATFLGGLTIGGGGIVGGSPINQIKNRSKRLVHALDETINSLDTHQQLSKIAMQLLAKPVFPKRIYTFFGNLGWKRRAKKYGVTNLYLTPDKK